MARNHIPLHRELFHSSIYLLEEDYMIPQPTFLEQHNMDFHMKSVIFHLSDKMNSTQNL